MEEKMDEKFIVLGSDCKVEKSKQIYIGDGCYVNKGHYQFILWVHRGADDYHYISLDMPDMLENLARIAGYKLVKED